ncbi:hypothetical protein [Aeoliella mucimassa]|uniref:hypothetical protein n=1 Tax=Aeoliella mucimassa TaxID=2527972 RepID=UPI00119E5F75|nr:hypothetical protein [Aeoliella mucimassa]
MERTHGWSRGRAIRVVLTLTLVLGTTPLTADTYRIDKPTTLSPNAGTRSAKGLPVETLGAVHGLDLSAPAKAKLPVLKMPVAKTPTLAPPAQADTSDELTLSMPALIAPQIDAPRVAQLPATAEPSSEQPTEVEPAAPLQLEPEQSDEQESTPEEFKPAWRSPKQLSTEEESAEHTPAPLKEVLPSDESTTEATPIDEPKHTELQPPKRNTQEADEPPIASFEVSDDLDQQDDEPTAEESPRTRVVDIKPQPVKQLPPLTRNQIYLRNKMRRVLTYYYRQMLNTEEHDSWKVMHNMLAFELHSQVRVGGPNGQAMTSVGWLCYNNDCAGHRIMALSDQGLPHGVYGVGKEGHSGQFLSMLAQCNVDPNYPIRVEGKEFTIHDLIAGEQKTCQPNSELSFKLIALMHYLPSDTTWVNERGEVWSIERLVEEELAQPIRGVACGGTHRLNGLSLAVKQREARGEPMDGVWLKAKNFTNQYEQYCYRLQNNDGSFSTEWFRGPGDEKSIDRRCRTTGHLTEWVLYHVPDKKLDSYRVVKAVNYLTNLLYSNSSNEWETGALCHALHALTEYDTRKFQPYDEQAKAAQAQSGGNSVSRQNNSATRR